MINEKVDKLSETFSFYYKRFFSSRATLLLNFITGNVLVNVVTKNSTTTIHAFNVQ